PTLRGGQRRRLRALASRAGGDQRIRAARGSMDRRARAPCDATPHGRRARANRQASEDEMTKEVSDTWAPAQVRRWVERHGGNVTALARRLRVPRTRLQNWMTDSEASRRSLPPYIQAHMETLDRLRKLDPNWEELAERAVDRSGAMLM